VNYISVEMLRYAAAVMEAIDYAPAKVDAALRCTWRSEPGARPCGEPATHFVPDATRVSVGGDIEEAPQWYCRKHLEQELGEPVRDQPISRRTRNPAE
jgi:hypothetical protein